MDITERKRAETVLHRYELLARHTRDIVLFIRRADGRIVEANAAAEAAYGYSREELLERTIFNLRSSDDVPATQAQMAAADLGGHPVRGAAPPAGWIAVSRGGELARHDHRRGARAAQRDPGHHRACARRAVAAGE